MYSCCVWMEQSLFEAKKSPQYPPEFFFIPLPSIHFHHPLFLHLPTNYACPVLFNLSTQQEQAPILKTNNSIAGFHFSFHSCLTFLRSRCSIVPPRVMCPFSWKLWINSLLPPPTHKKTQQVFFIWFPPKFYLIVEKKRREKYRANDKCIDVILWLRFRSNSVFRIVRPSVFLFSKKKTFCWRVRPACVMTPWRFVWSDFCCPPFFFCRAPVIG